MQRCSPRLAHAILLSPDHVAFKYLPSTMPGLLVLTASAGRLDITMSLPIVDISPYLADDFVYPPTAKQLACSAAIHQACLDFGFFYITGLGIPRQDFDDILELSKQFFDLPVDVKEALSIASTSNGTDGARGYQKLKVGETSATIARRYARIHYSLPVPCRKTRHSES